MRYRVDSQKAYSLFRLREVQSFLHRVDADAGPEVDAKDLNSMLREQRTACPREKGMDLVAQTLAAYLEEHGEQKQPKPLVREFFGELLMEQRRDRTIGDGVLLGTVHGSKGAEHEHVILLDSGWQLRGDDTWEERRRLYYVGMTRARQTLALLQCKRDGSPWVPTMRSSATHRTRCAPRPADAVAARTRHELLSQADINLGFAARDAEHERIDMAIDGLATRDPLRLVPAERILVLHDTQGRCVGALSTSASQRWMERLPQIRSVSVAAIVIRRRADEHPDFRGGLRRDAWQVVIPEVTYAVEGPTM